MEGKQKISVDQSPPSSGSTDTHLVSPPETQTTFQTLSQTRTETIHSTPPTGIATIRPTRSLFGSYFSHHPSQAGGILHYREPEHGPERIPLSTLRITREQKLTLKLIEKKRSELHEEESRLENDGNQVITLLVSMLSLYMLVFGGGIVINGGPVVAYITIKKNEHTLIIMVAATVCTYVAGIGLSILLAIQKLRRLSWKNTLIQIQRGNLKAESEVFRREITNASVETEVASSSGVSNVSVDSSGSGVTIESANTRIKACIDSLGSDYFYHGHMTYVISTGVIGTIFLGIIVTLMVFSYTEHKDTDFAVKLGHPYFPSLI